jgi:hypothetical protein
MDGSSPGILFGGDAWGGAHLEGSVALTLCRSPAVAALRSSGDLEDGEELVDKTDLVFDVRLAWSGALSRIFITTEMIYVGNDAIPVEKVVVFDEAQRAWTREQAAN